MIIKILKKSNIEASVNIGFYFEITIGFFDQKLQSEVLSINYFLKQFLNFCITQKIYFK